MSTQPDKSSAQPNDAFSTAPSGNASNPSPHPADREPMNDNRLLSENAEKYLREAGNIEDMPDAQDEEEADETTGNKGN